MTVVISPHIDDAVWSAHGLLHGATVITICAGIPPAGTPPTQFDTNAGFTSAAAAMRARRAEDHAAAAIAGFTVRHLNCLLCNYAAEQPLVTAVADALEGVDKHEFVAGPLGLRHPDHIVIAAAFAIVARDRDLNAWVYEELPYAYTHPEDLANALRAAQCPEHTITRRSAISKATAVDAYVSQTTGAHMDAILAPERYHPLNGQTSL